jgi:protein-L-isoaspartate(D-aspartate) O-methyltransferase
LRIGGILVVPVGDTEKDQTMCRITRLSANEFQTEKLDKFRFVPFLEGTE